MLRTVFFLVVLISFVTLVSPARPVRAAEESADGSAPSQAQATLASLFGRGATMPDLPNMRGTIAVPSFDSSKMKIDPETAGGKAEEAV